MQQKCARMRFHSVPICTNTQRKFIYICPDARKNGEKKINHFIHLEKKKTTVERKPSKDALLRRVIKKSQVLFLHALFNTVLGF